MKITIDRNIGTIPTDYSWQLGLGNDHAYILIENGSYYIVDNNTQNHTYLNEQRLEPSKPTQFHAGDTIRMADIVFSVVAGA